LAVSDLQICALSCTFNPAGGYHYHVHLAILIIDNLHGKIVKRMFFLSLKLNSKESVKDALLPARLVHA
jgi:hypothetical protein